MVGHCHLLHYVITIVSVNLCHGFLILVTVYFFVVLLMFIPLVLLLGCLFTLYIMYRLDLFIVFRNVS